MNKQVVRTAAAALLAFGIGGALVGCDSGSKAPSKDQFQAMPTDAKADYEKKMGEMMRSGGKMPSGPAPTTPAPK